MESWQKQPITMVCRPIGVKYCRHSANYLHKVFPKNKIAISALMPIKTIDEYIGTFPTDIQSRLNEIRKIIQESAPNSEEAMAYGIPTFKLSGNLVHFAGYTTHIGFYPTPSGITKFKKELEKFPSAKGSVQFPHNKPLPKKIISDIVKFRIQENLSKQK